MKFDHKMFNSVFELRQMSTLKTNQANVIEIMANKIGISQRNKIILSSENQSYIST